jgi:hypothetical protein
MDPRTIPHATTHSRLNQIRAKLAHYPPNAPSRLDTEWLIAMLEECVFLIQGTAKQKGEELCEEQIVAGLEALRG